MSRLGNGTRAYTGTVGVPDIAVDSTTGKPAKTRPDADRDGPRLRADRALLWTKELDPGVLRPTPPSHGRDGHLVLTDGSENQHRYGGDAISSSSTTWSRPRALVNAVAELDEDGKSRYPNPPYTIGSSLFRPFRRRDRTTWSGARGLRPSVGDRMDLTLECLRRRCTGEPESLLAAVIDAYADVFELFEGGFREFVDFFHRMADGAETHHAEIEVRR